MSYEWKGIDELQKKLKDVLDRYKIAAAVRTGALHIKGKVSIYPSASHRPQPFVSSKQRRFFFWALKAGKIEVPYRRGISPSSEDHGKSWTLKAVRGGLVYKIGSDTSYGPLLQSEVHQTAYHKKTGWKTIQQTAREEMDVVLKFIKKQIDKVLAS